MNAFETYGWLHDNSALIEAKITVFRKQLFHGIGMLVSQIPAATQNICHCHSQVQRLNWS